MSDEQATFEAPASGRQQQILELKERLVKKQKSLRLDDMRVQELQKLEELETIQKAIAELEKEVDE